MSGGMIHRLANTPRLAMLKKKVKISFVLSDLSLASVFPSLHNTCNVRDVSGPDWVCILL